METRNFVLPALALGAAALLLAPLQPSRAFSKLGESLDETQRDFRVANNFADATANDNQTPDPQFPGRAGAVLAIWKGVVEWGSRLHGDGSGDPIGGNLLGSGGANFDAMFGGRASQVGDPSGNIFSALSSCGGGTLAFTEVPISDGWRIRFCDEWNWDDGPGAIGGNRFDLQSAACRQYGVALGLGTSAVLGSTMSDGAILGDTARRSIEADDIAGIQCIYGVASVTKPVITATVASAGTLTIYGRQFDATSNEVWFTNAANTPSATDPIVRVTEVTSSLGGRVITVAIPAGAGKGDVMVRKPGTGGAVLSNAFPTDLVGTLGEPPPRPDITDVTPSVIEALIPGTVQTITLTGRHLDLVRSVSLDGVEISPSRYTIVDAATITLDMPQASSLGTHVLGVTDGVGRASPASLGPSAQVPRGPTTDTFSVTIVEPATPKLEWGTGDAFNVIDRDDGLDMIVSGAVGTLHVVRASPHAPPTFAHFFRPLDMPLVDAGSYVIPAEGWLSVHLDGLPDPALVGTTWFARSFAIVKPKPYPASNDQSITLVP